MELYLLRHALAAEAGPEWAGRDHARPLVPEGEKRMKRIAKGMGSLDLAFDLILTSPYVRARQTAEIVAQAFNAGKKLKFSEHLTPDGDYAKLIQALRRQHTSSASVLLVGHEPYLSGLISFLLSGEASLSITMKKAGLCKLTIAKLRVGRCATLEWLLTPRQLEGLA